MTLTHIPHFRQALTFTAPSIVRRHDAAARLGLSYDRLVKLIDAGFIAEPMLTLTIESLARRPYLAIDGPGELTVLRTGARTPANDWTGRPNIGASVDYDNAELASTGLGWWRSDPDRLLRNGLFAETVSTFPLATWDLNELVDSHGTDSDLRHLYAGTLLARLRYRYQVPDTEAIIFGVPEEQTVVTAPKELLGDPRVDAARLIMSSRIKVDSGGPIGYLEAPPQAASNAFTVPMSDPGAVLLGTFFDLDGLDQ